ncbi:MAG: SagB/ThcOx family dehydrogenase [Candidatus Aminicenantes bacterium]|nr:SagB/ThcOx family dehydrogenase [Candidatus Aminicenantes bacterium]
MKIKEEKKVAKEERKVDIKTSPLKLKKFSEVWFLPPIRDIIKEDDRGDLAEIFHANSKMTPYSEQSVGIKVVEMVNDITVERRTSQPYKDYGMSIPSYPLIPKEKLNNPQADLFDIIARRRTIRQYSDKKLTLEDISRLLYYTYGISGNVQLALGTIEDLRVISSGGGLYPLEVYLLVLNVEELPKGIYHYNVRKHSLELIKKGFEVNEILPHLPGLIAYQTRTVSLFVALSTIFRRTTHKYGPRGYRYICFEAGTFMGHLQLIAEALDLGSVQVAGYYDEVLNNLLGLDGVDEATLNICALGYKKEQPAAKDAGGY